MICFAIVRLLKKYRSGFSCGSSYANISVYFHFTSSVFMCSYRCLSNEKYYAKFYVNGTKGGKLNWQGEASFLFGILGFSFYAVVGIASLPSVGSAMTKAQWNLVMGPLVWAALAFGMTHVMIMGLEGCNSLVTCHLLRN